MSSLPRDCSSKPAKACTCCSTAPNRSSVYKALMSVGEMVHEGFRVVFDKDASGQDVSHALHKASGTK
eukprot:683364-Amphidinium_carterae.1